MKKRGLALLLTLLCLTGCGKKEEPASKIEDPEPIPVEEPGRSCGDQPLNGTSYGAGV